MQTRGRSLARRGFTLVEMLVVIGIILILMGIGVAFLPGAYQRSNTTNAAQVFQKALVKARMMAIRDRKVTGIQLGGFVAANKPSQFQYFQQPDDWTSGKASAVAAKKVQLTNPPVAPALPISIADAIEFDGTGVAHSITGVAGSTLTLASMPSYTPNQSNIRVIRRGSMFNNTLAGQEQVTFNGGIVIDLSNSTATSGGTAPAFPPGANSLSALGITTVAFTPNGGVSDYGAPLLGMDSLIFLITDPTLPNPISGQPMLVVVSVRTGAVAVQPADTSNGGTTPYTFAVDTRGSGL